MCDCLGKANEKLARAGLYLPTVFQGCPRALLLSLNATTHKLGPGRLYATFCPFCGQKYVSEEGAPKSDRSDGSDPQQA